MSDAHRRRAFGGDEDEGLKQASVQELVVISRHSAAGQGRWNCGSKDLLLGKLNKCKNAVHFSS